MTATHRVPRNTRRAAPLRVLDQLARIQTLDPDLIIAFSFDGECSHDVDVELLQRIAPTVAPDFAPPRAEYQAAIASLAVLEDELARQRREYEEQLAQVRAGIEAPEQLSVLTLGLFDGDVSVHLGPNPLVTIVRELGLPMPPLAVGDQEYLQVSPERIADPGRCSPAPTRPSSDQPSGCSPSTVDHASATHPKVERRIVGAGRYPRRHGRPARRRPP